MKHYMGINRGWGYSYWSKKTMERQMERQMVDLKDGAVKSAGYETSGDNFVKDTITDHGIGASIEASYMEEIFLTREIVAAQRDLVTSLQKYVDFLLGDCA